VEQVPEGTGIPIFSTEGDRLTGARARLRSACIALCAIIGCALQALRPDQVSPAWMYFTIWSAVSFASIATPKPSNVLRVLSRSGALGIIVSGSIYWILIAPVVQPRSISGWASTCLLHLVLPLFAIDLARRRALNELSRREHLLVYAMPSAYLLSTLLAQAIGVPAPYKFLSLELQGIGGALRNSLGVAVVFLVVDTFLHVYSNARRTSRR
jgi:hypothetical protein